MGVAAQAAIGFSSFFMLSGVALVTIAFGGNGWREYQVDVSPEFFAERIGPEVFDREGYFTRQFGFFKKCFPGAAPRNANLKQHPLGYQCLDIWYNDGSPSVPSDVLTFWINMKRLYLALYIVGLFFCFFALVSAFVGCIHGRGGAFIGSGFMLLIAAGWIAAGIGTWHKYVSLDEYEVEGPDHYWNFPEILKQHTTRYLGWAYIIAWVGVGLMVIAALLMFITSCVIIIGEKKRKEEEKRLYTEVRRPGYYAANKGFDDSQTYVAVAYPYDTYVRESFDKYPTKAYTVYTEDGNNKVNEKGEREVQEIEVGFGRELHRL